MGRITRGIAAVAAALTLAGCSGMAGTDTTRTITSPPGEPVFIPKTPTMEPVAAACAPAPTALVDTIDQLFTGGEHLEHAQAVAGPNDATYIGGNIVDATGRKVSSQDTWVKLGSGVFALTSDARSRTLAPDGRDLDGIYMEWPDYNTAVSECVGAVERADNAGG
jgi:hypothetical protein